METVTIKIKNKHKFIKFMEMVKGLDYIEVVSDRRTIGRKNREEDFFSLAGIWKDRDISQEDIRAKAWPVRK